MMQYMALLLHHRDSARGLLGVECKVFENALYSETTSKLCGEKSSGGCQSKENVAALAFLNAQVKDFV